MAVCGKRSGASAHYVRVDINRINRVGYAYGIGLRKYVAEVARIALCAVADKHLRGVDIESGIVVFDDGTAQKLVTLLGTVAAERVGRSHLVDCLMHRFDTRRRQRTRHVADAQAD